MADVSFAIPEYFLLALKLTQDRLADEIRLAAAMKLYEMGRLSSGAAAELAGIPKPVFLSRLSDYGIASFRMTPEDLADDFAHA